MGFQTGTIRISGKVGNLIFSKTANGDEVRTNSSLNAERLRTDPKFSRTRENWSEFSDAVKAGKLIRNTFALQSKNITDAQSHSRMLRHTMRTVKSDYTNERGNRRMSNGIFSHLIGYEFNDRQHLEAAFKTPFQIHIDRPAGVIEFFFPAFNPQIHISTIPGSTHFQLLVAAAEFDWNERKAISDYTASAKIPVHNPIVPPQTLSLTIPAGSAKTIILTMGITFYQEVNGQDYALSNRSLNAMAIVGVDHI